jgi:hypothetical protein
MKRFFITATLVAVGLTLLANQTWAGGNSGNGSGRPSNGSNHRESEHSFRTNERFDFNRHGFKSFSWSHYRWSNDYHRYIYWGSSYGWCFYEPSYGYYVPVSHYSEVYPTAPTVAPTSIPAPPVVQQTTVVTAPTGSSGVLPPPPPPAEVGPPAPTAVQKTNVGNSKP